MHDLNDIRYANFEERYQCLAESISDRIYIVEPGAFDNVLFTSNSACLALKDLYLLV